MSLGGPERKAAGGRGHLILNGLTVEVNVKVDKCLVLGNVLQLLRKFTRLAGTVGDKVLLMQAAVSDALDRCLNNAESSSASRLACSADNPIVSCHAVACYCVSLLGCARNHSAS